MDTRFPLLQPKHHCVKVTGERPWETNQSQEWEQNMGVELDRTRARDERLVEERRRHCCSHAKKTWRRRKLSLSGQRSKERRDLRRVEEGGRSERFWRGRRGGDCVILSLACPWTLGDLQAGWLGILLQKLRKMEKNVSHTNVLQANSTGRLLWLGERESVNKRGHNSWSSWYGNFFKLKAWIEALHLITSKHPGEKSVKTPFGYSSELKKCLWCCDQMKFEDYIATDHPLFFLSFELESFLNKGCFHWGFSVM